MNAQLVLSITENREAIRAISIQVLEELAMNEIESSTPLIEPLLDMVAEGRVVTVEDAREAGGFGAADLLVMVIVPLVVSIVANVLTEMGKASIEELKQSLKREKEAKVVIKITIGDVEAVVTRTRSQRGKRKIKALAKAVNTALIRYLDN